MLLALIIRIRIIRIIIIITVILSRMITVILISRIMIIICIGIGFGVNHSECKVQSAIAPTYSTPPLFVLHFYHKLLLGIWGYYLLVMGYGHLLLVAVIH